jgi:hypothetical protein
MHLHLYQHMRSHFHQQHGQLPLHLRLHQHMRFHFHRQQ